MADSEPSEPLSRPQSDLVPPHSFVPKSGETAGIAGQDPVWLVDGLSRVESALRHVVETHDPFLSEVASHLIVAGGKRMRPAFTLAAALTASTASADETVSDEVVMGGVAVELVHLGSLYHDDVIDEATTRRTVDSVNARWGNLTAILAGDFLLAKASEIAASLGTEVAALLARTIGRLCEGEVLELRSTFDVERTEDGYLDAIRGKTASLFATACRVGAIVGGLDRPSIESLTTFGERFGMAFQVVDDVLDLVGTEAELGKPCGHDLVEGVYTLPVLRALEAGTAESDRLRQTLGRPLGDAEREEVRASIRTNGAVSSAIEVAERFVSEARAGLGSFGNSRAATWLADAANLLVSQVAPHRRAE